MSACSTGPAARFCGLVRAVSEGGVAWALRAARGSGRGVLGATAPGVLGAGLSGASYQELPRAPAGSTRFRPADRAMGGKAGPAGDGPAGDGPTGGGPAGTGPAGTGPAGPGPAIAWPATAGEVVTSTTSSSRGMSRHEFSWDRNELRAAARFSSCDRSRGSSRVAAPAGSAWLVWSARGMNYFPLLCGAAEPKSPNYAQRDFFIVPFGPRGTRL
jgi:hypothetical protein